MIFALALLKPRDLAGRSVFVRCVAVFFLIVIATASGWAAVSSAIWADHLPDKDDGRIIGGIAVSVCGYLSLYAFVSIFRAPFGKRRPDELRKIYPSDHNRMILLMHIGMRRPFGLYLHDFAGGQIDTEETPAPFPIYVQG